MTFTKPVVLDQITLPEVLEWMLDNHAPLSILLVCSGLEAFTKHLLSAATSPRESRRSHEAAVSTREQSAPSEADALEPQSTSFLLQMPTLRLLSSSRTIKVVFCPELAHLRAYLSTHCMRHLELTGNHMAHSGSVPILAVLNPIQLHRPTSAFSAQGLNRTFAAAVEAARAAGQELVFAECTTEVAESNPDLLEDLDDEQAAAQQQPSPVNPWDQEVSMLNVTTKSFGAGERGWVGRSVRIRRIAERWCTFEKLPSVGRSQ